MVLLAGRITSGRAKGVSMGSISLFNTVDNLYNTTQPTTDNTAQKTAATQPDATASQEDSVKLSTTAQAKSMYKQGQSVANIAASLGTDTKTVNNLLGITLEKAIEKTLETTLKA
jgi:DNA-binding ferritin-like protein